MVWPAFQPGPDRGERFRFHDVDVYLLQLHSSVWYSVIFGITFGLSFRHMYNACTTLFHRVSGHQPGSVEAEEQLI